jgi:hypothetical protein
MDSVCIELIVIVDHPDDTRMSALDDFRNWLIREAARRAKVESGSPHRPVVHILYVAGRGRGALTAT